MRLTLRVADHYPMADRDLLLAGALLHDIDEGAGDLAREKGFDYTDEGRLVGHLVMTAQKIREKTLGIPGFPPLLEQHLTHLVLAHHGQLEYGSPKLPMTLEAHIVHALDSLDSRIASLAGGHGARPERDAGPSRPSSTIATSGRARRPPRADAPRWRDAGGGPRSGSASESAAAPPLRRRRPPLARRSSASSRWKRSPGTRRRPPPRPPRPSRRRPRCPTDLRTGEQGQKHRNSSPGLESGRISDPQGLG